MHFGRFDRPVIAALIFCIRSPSACAGLLPPPVSAPPPQQSPASEISSGAAPQYDVIVVGAGLAGMYGIEVVSHINDEKSRVTRWGQNPWTLGSYSSALPGKSKMHEAMAEPVDDLVFFGGEACGPPEYNGSLAAALVSGRQASRQVHDSLEKAMQHVP